jgi:hypothetical protein
MRDAGKTIRDAMKAVDERASSIQDRCRTSDCINEIIIGEHYTVQGQRACYYFFFFCVATP